jgi:DNA ligase-1
VFLPTGRRTDLQSGRLSPARGIGKGFPQADPFMIDVRIQRGIYVADCDLWLDPRDAQEIAFVSHAHSDHVAAHRAAIMTPETAALLNARLGGGREELIHPYGSAWPFRDAQCTLLPSGHVLGGAQLFLEHDRGSLLYTGDFKVRPGLSCPPVEPRHAETLVIETTFGLPMFVFPPREETVAKMVAFCVDALADGEIPVLFCYSLGKAQEVVCELARAGLPAAAHSAVHQVCEVYRAFMPDFPPVTLWKQGSEPQVVICPPSASRSAFVRSIPKKRTLALTGWAMHPGAKFRYGVDEALPLSDHADYQDLLDYVEQVNPARVLTQHGSAREFAADLRRRGREAWALGVEEQMEFRALTVAIPYTPSAAAAVHEEHESGWGGFVRLCEHIRSTGSKKAKVALLAEYLARLPGSDLQFAARSLAGAVFARSSGRLLQMGGSIVQRAVAGVSRRTLPDVKALMRRAGDLGDGAAQILPNADHPRGWELQEVRELLEQLAAARGPLRKQALLESALAVMHPQHARYLIKLITGDLRIGLREGLVEEAVASAFEVTQEDVQEAYMLSGDMGSAAVLARDGRLHEANLQPFRPVRCMLASPEPSAIAIWGRLAGPGFVEVEDKLDGIRAQLHVTKESAALFSRDLRDITREFPELAKAAEGFTAEVILDGEIVARSNERNLGFFDLQKRLGRHQPDFFMASDVPVRFAAFDILWRNGESLVRSSLEVRRAILDALPMPALFELVPREKAASPEEIDVKFREARARGNEGLMVKDPASRYAPGRRGMAWIKYKKAFETLDVVIVGAEWGHGKRKDVLSDYTFAVREASSGALLPIGKAYSGLADEEIAELTQHLLQTTLREEGRYREVVPSIVLEVAFDSIQPSARHASGFALRFPRIKAIRRDKSVQDIDTLETARRLANANGTLLRQPS